MPLFHFFLTALLTGVICIPALSAENLTELQKIHSPKIVGKTLYIKGPIQSHIYDFLSYEYKALQNVQTVSLNSLGGHSDWALEIGRKIKELGLQTKVEKGNRCASACIYLLGSGTYRTAHESVWLGIHGARLGKGAFVDMNTTCLKKTDNGLFVFSPDLEGCTEKIKKWYKIAKKTTDTSFDLLEASGVSSELRKHYYRLPEDPNWFANGNVLKIENWVLQPHEAKKYFLIHEVLLETQKN